VAINCVSGEQIDRYGVHEECSDTTSGNDLSVTVTRVVMTQKVLYM
jgi:hypothetical protein